MSSVAFYSLGCKVNQYEVNAMSELFAARGYDIVAFDDVADIYVVNTCTVTGVSDKKSRQMIRKARKLNPFSVVCAVGCYAQVSPNEVSSIDGVNLIVGSKNKSRIVDLVEDYSFDDGVACFVSDISDAPFDDLSVSDFKGRTRAFIKIQEGCCQFCSYCIVPYSRGSVCSRSLDDIYSEVSLLADRGFKEIVLTGIHVASYGVDLDGVSLLDVIKKIHGVDGIERIRLSSIDPLVVTERFVSELSLLGKVCNHFHLSLQSGSDSILKKMNRRYSARQYENAVALLRDAFGKVAIWTDVIVGFPGESDTLFLESFDFIKSIALSKLHVFQFSPRKGTPAASFPLQVDSHLKELRSKKMIALSDSLFADFLNDNIGDVTTVLFERKSADSLFWGLTPNYIKVFAHSDFDLCNKLSKTLLKFNEQSFVNGEIIFA